MSEPKFEPGPWHIEFVSGDGINIYNSDNTILVAGLWGNETGVADATLIAAAPLLYEACKAALAEFYAAEWTSEVVDDLRAALRLADEGGGR